MITVAEVNYFSIIHVFLFLSKIFLDAGCFHLSSAAAKPAFKICDLCSSKSDSTYVQSDLDLRASYNNYRR